MALQQTADGGLLSRLKSIQVSRTQAIAASIVTAVVFGTLGYFLFSSGKVSPGSPEAVQKQAQQSFGFLSSGTAKKPAAGAPVPANRAPQRP